jgi:hypothetical protein
MAIGRGPDPAARAAQLGARGNDRVDQRHHAYRSEFNWLLHVACPIITTGALIAVGYFSLNPAPVFPYDWALPICGAWLVVGVIVLVVLKIRGHETWMQNAGEAVLDRPAEPAASDAG